MGSGSVQPPPPRNRNAKGLGIAHYLGREVPDLIGARRTVNITDRWKLVAAHYSGFMAAIEKAGIASVPAPAPAPTSPTPSETGQVARWSAWMAERPPTHPGSARVALPRPPAGAGGGMTTPSPLRPVSIPWTELAGRLGRIGLHAASQALAGPSGAAVAQRIAAALGVEPTPSAIEAALAADPDAAVKLVAAHYSGFMSAIEKAGGLASAPSPETSPASPTPQERGRLERWSAWIAEMPPTTPEVMAWLKSAPPAPQAPQEAA